MILRNPQFGPAISNWMNHKSIDKKSKCAISFSIVIGFAITLLISTPSLVMSAFLLSGMLMLLLYINTRAENIRHESISAINVPEQSLVA